MNHLYKEQRSEGIVLNSFLYKDHDRIITVFMKEEGLISLMIKKAKQQSMISSPFCQCEFLYIKGKSDLYKFHDGTVIEDHMSLRSSLRSLSGAGEMVQAVLHSQMPGKPAPKLYALLAACMKQLPTFEPIFRLTTSFRLRLLTHEGIISWEDASLFPISLNRTEWELLKESTHTHSFQKIKEIEVTEELSLKIQNQFKILI